MVEAMGVQVMVHTAKRPEFGKIADHASKVMESGPDLEFITMNLERTNCNIIGHPPLVVTLEQQPTTM